MGSNAKHSAAGQMAGYLFQPERAMYHLATSPAGAVVGIETLDDIAVLFPDGTTLLEQDKHNALARTPLAEGGKDLWNSLSIWLAAVESGDADLETTEFHLVTNRNVSAGFSAELLKRGREDKDLKTLVELLRAAGSRASESIRPIVESVLSKSDQLLADLLRKVRVVDAREGTAGAELKKKAAAALHLPPAHAEEVIHGLLGWVHDTAVELIRQRQPAWLKREAFTERYLRLVTAFQDRRFLNETAEAMIPVTAEKRQAHKRRLFVKQLLWIGVAEEDEQLVEAIDDFIRGSSERTRLAKEGIASLADFRAFEDRLVSRWRGIHRVQVAKSKAGSEEGQRGAGQAVLQETLNHREPLGGYLTQEWYLTRGAYHRLADAPSVKPRIGWHPDYGHLSKLETENDTSHEPDDRS